MNESKQGNRIEVTPGEWEWAYGAIYVKGTAPPVCLARMDRLEPATSPAERDANGRLMAQAKAMRDVLRRVQAMLDIASQCGVLDRLADDMHPDEINGTCDAVQDVLAGVRAND